MFATINDGRENPARRNNFKLVACAVAVVLLVIADVSFVVPTLDNRGLGSAAFNIATIGGVFVLVPAALGMGKRIAWDAKHPVLKALYIVCFLLMTVVALCAGYECYLAQTSLAVATFDQAVVSSVVASALMLATAACSYALGSAVMSRS